MPRFLPTFFREADTGGAGGAGGGSITPPVVATAAAAPPAPVTGTNAPRRGDDESTQDYISRLRDENKGWRLKVAEAEKTAADVRTAAAEKAAAEANLAAEKRLEAKYSADLKTALEKAQADAEGRITEAGKASNARIIAAELKAQAVKAGMVDLDGLKLLDTSKVTLDDKGEVVVPEDFFTTAKTAKPWLFAAPQAAPVTGAATGNTSASATPPKPAVAGKHVSEMSDAEAEAELARLIAPTRR
jgi:hypothetical protein